MQNMLLEVKAIRRCNGGHTCNLVANSRKVAFIAPGVFEWTNYSKKIDVLTWFASKKKAKIAEIKPVELKQGWESKIPDYKMDDERYNAVEGQLLEWIRLYFTAYEIAQRCKSTLITLGHKGELLDWCLSPKSGSDALKRVTCSQFTSKLLNGLSIAELVEIMEKTKDLKMAA